MPYTDISQNGMNYVTLRQVVNDYVLTLDGDDYGSNVSDTAIRNIALRGVREFGFDVTSRVKSIKRAINPNNTIDLPDDFVDVIKLGAVGADGILRLFRRNKNINYSRSVLQDMTADGSTIANTILTNDSEEGPLDIEANLILNREDDKGSTSSSSTSSSSNDYYVFQNYLYQGGLGRLYGAGGGHAIGDYRVNLDQNRIELDTDNNASEVVIEYIADEARSTNPVIHVYAEEALRCYIYYKLCERKSTVPANEKARSRAEYYNERRKAKSRLGGFSKDEALRVIRKNFKQSPKY